jgi:crotonobetainyl-CoA:carnitine CoA-transferase CaiB-like acyl-CoA transferase
MVTEWQHPVKSDLRLVSSPIKLSATPVATRLPPPLLGQHTEEVLRGVLNYSEAKLSELKRNEVI